MLNVFLTVDVEIWCDGWADIDRKFPKAFRSYIYGPTPAGEYGLRYQAGVLRDHGLNGVFFVEPLFACRFGNAPLSEIVGVLRDAGQEIQLHLHTEWVDEALTPLLPGIVSKRQFLRNFNRDEQTQLIAEGVRRLGAAGAPPVNCFRAGSFGFNTDTLAALGANGIHLDSSYNATIFGLDSGLAPGTVLTDVYCEGGLTEFPMTVFDPGFGRLRHAQLGACSWAELEGLLWRALKTGQQSFVLLSHNYELLTPSKTRPDPVVVRRFQRLCAFLDRHRDKFRTRGFHGIDGITPRSQQQPLHSSAWASMTRTVEQVYRRVYT